MLTSDVISRVRRTAGDVDVLQFTDADMYAWINDACRECASDNNLLQVTATNSSVIGDGEYDLPTNILKLHSVKYDNSKLRMITMQQADEEFNLDDTTGTPIVGYVWAGKLNLYPLPDSVKDIKVMYTRTPLEVTEGTDEIDLPIMYHRRVVDYCLAMVAEQDDDQNRYAVKMQEFRSGVQNLKDQPEWENDLYPFITTAPRDTGEGYELELW